MRNWLLRTLLIASILLGSFSLSPVHAVDCNAQTSFFGIPTWHMYLNKVEDKNSSGDPTGSCSIVIESIWDIGKVVAAIMQIIFRLAIFLTVIYMLFSSYQFISSRGQPDRTARARQSLTYAVIGLIVALVASVLVGFIAGALS